MAVKKQYNVLSAMTELTPPAQQPKPTFEGLLQRQLFTYASELGEHFRKVRELSSDLAERERQLNQLVSLAVAGREAEQQRIACEVHDRVAQTLVTVFQQLQALEPLTEPETRARKLVIRACGLLKDAIKECRNIMDDLHPPVCDELGLTSLIKEELRRFRDDTGCKTRLSVRGKARPPQNVEEALFRVFHEAMINVKRHARGATTVVTSVTFSDHSLSLRIQDDGSGFDTKNPSDHVGGLMTMRRRVEFLGGTCEIMSQPGHGTTVDIQIPLPAGNGQGKKQDLSPKGRKAGS